MYPVIRECEKRGSDYFILHTGADTGRIVQRAGEMPGRGKGLKNLYCGGNTGRNILDLIPGRPDIVPPNLEESTLWNM